jgi:hypothetical protein
MNSGADVRALDALQDWHDALCVFRTDAQESISSIAMEIRRAFEWVDEQAKRWYYLSRDAEEEVVRAKAELNQRRTPNFDGRIPDTSVQEENLDSAKARLEFALNQVDVCRKWAIKLPRMISEEYEGSSRRLGNFLEADLTNAIVQLNERVVILQQYMSITPVEVKPVELKPETPESSS